MNLIYAVLAFLAALVFALLGVSRAGAWLIERRYPPAGAFMEIAGARIHYVHLPAPAGADLPPLVFIHGASANLNDQMIPLRPELQGRAEMLFLDRPGHGWSGRGPGDNEDPAAQAQTIATLMDRLGIGKAVLVSHSFGGAVAAAFAVHHPDRTLGLVFLSPATHPWPGGETSWYYRLSAMPLVGWLFSQTLAYPAGSLRIDEATVCVFAPNRVPDAYVGAASIPLVLRPGTFRANSVDVAGLYAYVRAAAPDYKAIRAPTVIVTGDRDKVVYAKVHSLGLARDIPGAEIVWVHNLGHKPDWIAPDLVVAAIEKAAGRPRDLQAAARAVEARIAGDAEGEGRCPDIDVPTPELAPS